MEKAVSIARWIWLPIPLALLVLGVLWAADLRGVFIAPTLTLVLQLVFVTAASALVAYLMSRAFLASGSWGALLLVCGILLWGLAGVTARLAGPGNFNGSVTIHNVSVWLAASCHLVGVLLAPGPRAAAGRRHWWLLGAYSAVAAALMGVVAAMFAGWTPQFFVQGHGGTAVRQIVLGSAAAMLAISALFVWGRNRASASDFARWYALGLGLAATGLLGVLISTVHSGALNWAGVLTQFLSGVYFVAAANAASRESGVVAVSFARAPAEARFRYALAIMFVAAALAVRMLFHEALGVRTLYVTFFPAVIFATLYGGRGPGVAAIALSALAINYFFMEPLGDLRIRDASDVLVLALFVVSALLIVWITELMQRSQARAAAVEIELRLADERRRAMQEADRAKDEFLAMLSHELRNPLAALTTAAHVLRVVEPGDAAAEEARSVIDRQSSHMAHLLDDLLDISRLTVGKVTLEREPLDLAQAVEAKVRVWRMTGRASGEVRVVLDTSPAWVDADPDRIEQVVSNLLDNALKFTPSGGTVSISVREEPGAAILRVSDTGRGIDSEMIGRVFEPFHQGQGAKGGMGLGLALVKRLVELHGGSVSAHSEGEGRGTSFTVRLPIVAPKPQGEVQPRGRPRPCRVLLIEDNADAREMLRKTLDMGGHEVHAVADGESGVKAAAQAPPDIAVVDIGLPGIDGYEVARRLRAAETSGHMSLIALTGFGQPGDQRRALEAGFDAHLTKPIAPEQLEQLMARLQ